jgi:CP family cyanate transporter-like MFS transporter
MPPGIVVARGARAGAVGALFSLVMTLPLDVCDDPRDVGAVAAIMLGVGYVLAAAAPAALGAVRDGTGSFVPVIWLLLAAAAAFAGLAVAADTS